MIRNLSKVLLVFLTSITLLVSTIESSIAAYPSAPSDLQTLKSDLLKSLVLIKWESNRGLGFAGDYNISQESKNNGTNSIVVTSLTTVSENFDLVRSCFSKYRNNNLIIENNSRTYQGRCNSFSSGGADLATIHTSLTLPVISLYDSYIPSIDEWLIAAYYLEGFGIQFATTKVKLVNLDNFVLAVEKFEPKPVAGALLFNALGNFVGVLTSNGIGTVPSEYYKVHGAPLQCQTKGQTSGSITLCPNTQDKIWTTSNPGEPAVPAVADPLQEAIDSNKAFSVAFSALKSSVENCNLTLNISDSAIKSELRRLAFNNSCDYLLTKGNAVFNKTLKIPTVGKSSTLAEINNVVDLWNSATDEMKLLSEEADSYDASAQDAIDSIEKVLDLEKNSVSINKFIQNNYKKLNNQITFLPSKEKTKVTNLDEYLDLNLSISQFNKIKSYISDFRNGRYDILEAARLINELEVAFSLDSINYDYEFIQGFIPKYVCIKGKTILNFNSKCQAGYAKKQLK